MVDLSLTTRRAAQVGALEMVVITTNMLPCHLPVENPDHECGA